MQFHAPAFLAAVTPMTAPVVSVVLNQAYQHPHHMHPLTSNNVYFHQQIPEMQFLGAQTTNSFRAPVHKTVHRTASQLRTTTTRQPGCRTRDASSKPIVILVSIKDVEVPREDTMDKAVKVPESKRRTRASLRTQVEQQLLAKRSVEDLKEPTKAEVLPYCKNRYVALDCEMVGVGSDGKENALARVSICDFNGKKLLDCFVKPVEEVTDFRTHVTGIKSDDLDYAAPFDEVRIKVIDIIRDKVLVGHALENDLQVLQLAHPVEWIRDTAHAKYLREKTACPWNMPGLKKLVSLCLPEDFPFRKGNNHDSLEDARAPMEIYKKYWREFEREVVSGAWTCSPTFMSSPHISCSLL